MYGILQGTFGNIKEKSIDHIILWKEVYEFVSMR